MRMRSKAICGFTLLIAVLPVWAARAYTVEWSVSLSTEDRKHGNQVWSL